MPATVVSEQEFEKLSCEEYLVPPPAQNVIPWPVRGTPHAKTAARDLPVSLHRLGVAVRELDDLRRCVERVAGVPQWSGMDWKVACAPLLLRMPRARRSLADLGEIRVGRWPDTDWAVRVRAASLLKQFDPSTDADTQIRPAPTTLAPDRYRAPRIASPPVSTQVYIDTDRGTIQIELAVLDASLTVENFVTLARKGFFNGLPVHRVVPNFVIQDGDPRGDGEGGPGYTIRDELNELPYLRGTVGMALDWADTGGSQYFITHSPQPHLDAKYTVFGRVVDGMDVVDRIQQWDVIRRVRVWDGATMSAR